LERSLALHNSEIHILRIHKVRINQAINGCLVPVITIVTSILNIL
jgi:hypothetical protein